MRLITHTDTGHDLSDYLKYLESIRDKLPPNARLFAFSPGHYDIVDHRCPHDSWVDSIAITEHSKGKRNEVRHLEIVARFIGAFHDGFFEITYIDVKEYLFSLERTLRGESRIGHGDWIVDEILLQPNGNVSHEIVFSDSGQWKITCADIIYQWSAKQ